MKYTKRPDEDSSQVKGDLELTQIHQTCYHSYNTWEHTKHALNNDNKIQTKHKESPKELKWGSWRKPKRPETEQKNRL